MSILVRDLNPTSHPLILLFFNRGPNLKNTAYHQSNKVAAELNTILKSMRDEVLAGVHALVEGQAEAPPVEAVQEYPEKMNATTEVNYQLLKLIQ